MAFNPLSGIQGSVKIGVTSFAFGKWSLAMKGKSVNVNNFTLPYDQWVGGVIGSSLTLDAKTLDRGNMPFAVNTVYTFILGFDTVESISVPILVDEITPTHDIDGAPAVRISGKSTGAFTAAIA